MHVQTRNGLTMKCPQKFSNNARRKLERFMAPAMPCKRQPSITKVVAKPEFRSEKSSKTVYGCKVQSPESTRQRAESSQSKNHEDHIARKRFTSMSHYHLVHKFIPMPQEMKIPDAKSRKWIKNGKNSWEKSRARRRFFWKHKETKKESPLCRTDGHMSPQKCGVGTNKYRRTKAESCSGRGKL